MDIFSASGTSKITSDLTKGAIMNSTEKFVKTTESTNPYQKPKLEGYGWGARNRK